MKYVLTIISLALVTYTAYISFSSADQTLLDKTIEHNINTYKSCFLFPEGSTGSDVDIYRKAENCWRTQRRNTPNDLYLTVPKVLVDQGKCSISQTEDQHVRPERGGMYATDLACNFPSQGVYAPDYLDQMIEYKIESVGYDNLLGNFVILSFKDSPDMRWYFGHTVLDAGWEVGKTVTTGVRFAHADLSGVTSGSHTHIEFRRHLDGIWQSVRYVSRAKERKLEEKRHGGKSSGTGEVAKVGEQLNTYYFTAYNLGDPYQNDENPCVGSSGKDLCKMEAAGIRTMALTVDIRNKMGIKFGDKVALTGEIGCEGLYQVEDEMNKRFRENCILRPGTQYCIKGDIPSKKGGACSVQKL